MQIVKESMEILLETDVQKKLQNIEDVMDGLKPMPQESSNSNKFIQKELKREVAWMRSAQAELEEMEKVNIKNEMIRSKIKDLLINCNQFIQINQDVGFE